VLGDISFTTNLWSDPLLWPFFAITAHWLACHTHSTGLELWIALIAFHHVNAQHTGKSPHYGGHGITQLSGSHLLGM